MSDVEVTALKRLGITSQDPDEFGRVTVRAQARPHARGGSWTCWLYNLNRPIGMSPVGILQIEGGQDPILVQQAITDWVRDFCILETIEILGEELLVSPSPWIEMNFRLQVR